MAFFDKFKKAAAQATTVAKSILVEAQDTFGASNTELEDLLREQIAAVAVKPDKKPLRASPEALTDNSLQLQNHILKVNAALTLYPNARTTILIKRIETASYNKLIEESYTPDDRKSLAIWNEKTKSRDTYEEIFTEKAFEGGCAQFTSFYDVANGRLSINYAGTVFTDISDIKSASQTITDAPASLRMTRVKESVDQMVSAFNKFYPGKIEKTPIDIYAHSAGASCVALTNYFLQSEHGLIPHAQIMIEPCGAKNSFEDVSAMIAEAEGADSKKILDILSRNTISFKPTQRTFVDSFDKLKFLSPNLGNSPATIGPVKTVDVGGNTFSAHQIRTWVKYFNKEELKDVQKPILRIIKKSTGTQPH